jgi:hypothetical protein
MKVDSITLTATIHGFTEGCHSTRAAPESCNRLTAVLKRQCILWVAPLRLHSLRGSMPVGKAESTLTFFRAADYSPLKLAITLILG